MEVTNYLLSGMILQVGAGKKNEKKTSFKAIYRGPMSLPWKRRGKFPSTWFTPKNSRFQLPKKNGTNAYVFQVIVPKCARV